MVEIKARQPRQRSGGLCQGRGRLKDQALIRHKHSVATGASDRASLRNKLDRASWGFLGRGSCTFHIAAQG
jgi:hypothetical protein